MATITITGNLAQFSACQGSPSATQTFTVSGSGLTADLTITPPTGYEISTTSSFGYSNTLTLTQSSGIVSNTTIYVRLSSSAVNGDGGNIIVTSTNAQNKTIATGNALVIPNKEATISVIDAVCNAGGRITVNAIGGLGLYQYSIDGGITWQTSNIFNGLINGTYSISIKDINQPFGSSTFANTIDPWKTSYWQSFKSPITAIMTNIEIILMGALGTPAISTSLEGTLKIYQGQGNSTNPIHTQNIQMSQSININNYNNFILTNEVNIIKDLYYTFEIIANSNLGIILSNFNNSHPYDGIYSNMQNTTAYHKIYTTNYTDCILTKTATINNILPTISPIIPNPIQGSGSITLTANASSGTIYWYNSMTSTTPLQTGPTFNTGIINRTTVYYVEAVVSPSCKSQRVAVTATVNAISYGDPYITTLSGKTYKLADERAIYRLFEGDNIIINAEVDYIGEEQQNKLKEIEKSLKEKHPNLSKLKMITNGVLYSKFYINNDGEEILFDLKTKKIHKLTKINNIIINNSYESTNNIMGIKECKCMKVPIIINSKNYGKINLELQFYENPQIENGISLNTEKSGKFIGLLVDTFKESDMKINDIKDNITKLNNNYEIIDKKNITEDNEIWTIY